MPSVRLIRVLEALGEVQDSLRTATTERDMLEEGYKTTDLTQTEAIASLRDVTDDLADTLRLILGAEASMVSRLQKPLTGNFVLVETKHHQYGS